MLKRLYDKATVVKNQNVKETSGKKSSSPTKLRKRFASVTEGLSEKAREVTKRHSLSSPGRSILNNSPKSEEQNKRDKDEKQSSDKEKAPKQRKPKQPPPPQYLPSRPNVPRPSPPPTTEL